MKIPRNGANSTRTRHGLRNRDGTAGGPPYAPLLSAIRVRWTWLVAGAMIGFLVGAILSGGSGHRATATLQFTESSQDSTRTKQVAQTLERSVTSSAVLRLAAAERGLDEADLATRTSAAWEQDTDLVNVTVEGPDAESAVADADAVAEAAVANAELAVKARLDRIRAEANRLLTSERLSDPAAEAARRGQLGAAVAARQDAAAADATAVFVSNPAGAAGSAGVSRAVGAAMGAVAGLLLAAAAAALISVRRRRVRGAGDLALLAPDLSVRSGNPAGEIAGRLLESDRKTVVVAALAARVEANAIAAEISDRLKAHGSTVAMIDTTAPGWSQKLPEVFRHDIRSGVPENFASENLIVVCNAGSDTLHMLAGQTSFIAVVVAPRRTRLNEIRRTVSILMLADPIVTIPS